jgi:hypothetical protein
MVDADADADVDADGDADGLTSTPAWYRVNTVSMGWHPTTLAAPAHHPATKSIQVSESDVIVSQLLGTYFCLLRLVGDDVN